MPIRPLDLAACGLFAACFAVCRFVGAGWRRAAVSGGIWAAIVAWRFGSCEWAHNAIPLVTPSQRGVSFCCQRWLVRWRSDRSMLVDRSERHKPRGPPPSLRSATTVLAATRGTDARPNAAIRGGRFAERLAERGARGEPPSLESAARALPGADWAPRVA